MRTLRPNIAPHQKILILYILILFWGSKGSINIKNPYGREKYKLKNGKRGFVLYSVKISNIIDLAVANRKTRFLRPCAPRSFFGRGGLNVDIFDMDPIFERDLSDVMWNTMVRERFLDMHYVNAQFSNRGTSEEIAEALRKLLLERRAYLTLGKRRMRPLWETSSSD